MVNKAILLGNVGQSPDIKTLDDGVKIGNFSLATNKSWKDKTTGEKKTRTDWHRIVVARKLAEVVEKYVEKGSKLYIEGEIRQRDYEDKEGKKQYITEIFCNTLKMLGSNEAGQREQQQAEMINNDMPESDQGDDLPF